MKLAYEMLEVWQLAMRLVEITHSLREQFPQEEKYGLWSQLISAVESTPLLIAEGYGRRTPPDRAHFMDQAIGSNLETKTAYQISVKKGDVTRRQFKKLVSPLTEKIHFKPIGFKKYLLKGKTVERSDQPAQPNVVINRLNRAPRGFTLVEILVAFGILGIIAVMGTNMFFTILKGSAKTRVLAEVKQNGDYAINVMERRIRNAKSLSGGGDLVVIVNPDDSSTTFGCSGGKITLGVESLISEEVEVEDGDCPSVFTVTAGVAGVRPAVVVIDFTLQQAGADTRPEERATIDFGTTVSLRNY